MKKISLMTTAAALALFAFALIASPAKAEPFAYVANGPDNSVSVIDTASNTVVGLPILVGSFPNAVAITPDGKFAYVVNRGSNDTSVIDTDPLSGTYNTVVDTVNVGTLPFAAAVTPDGAFLYVANYLDNTVSVIDTASNTVMGAAISVGSGPTGIAITPDGKFAYVTNEGSNDASVIDTTSKTVVVPSIPVGSLPEAIAATPDGKFAYVANLGSNDVSVIDTDPSSGTYNTVVATVIPPGFPPIALALTPDGKSAYVVNVATNNVSVIDTDPLSGTYHTVTATVGVGTGPLGVAITPDSKFAYVTNGNDGTVSVIDTTSNTVPGAAITVGNFPAGLAITPSLGPDIDVAPLAYDFGQVDAFTSSETIVTVSNTGAADLTLTEISLSGDSSYSLPMPESLPSEGTPVVLAPSETLDVTVEFFPTSVCDGCSFNATLSVKSDDPDEPNVTVSLVGNGLAGAVEDQASALEMAVEDAIANGGLVGSGEGQSADARLNAFQNMIEAAGDLIEAGFIEDACVQLKSARDRIDGSPIPPDFVAGDDAALIKSQVDFLIDSLGCA